MERQSERRHLLLIAHGAALMLLGMLCGFAFTFYLLGEIGVSPIPFAWGLEMPGSERGWRAAHLGNILNGLMIVAMATALGRVRLSETADRWVFGSLLVTGWGNAAFYLFGNLAPNRGLSLGANRLGEGNAFGALAYVPAIAAAVCVIGVLILLLQAALRDARRLAA
jgi:hypothetical protein